MRENKKDELTQTNKSLPLPEQINFLERKNSEVSPTSKK